MQHVHYYVGEDAAHTGLGTPYTWKCARISDLTNSPASGLFDEQDMLKPFHPLFVIAHEAAQKLRAWSEGQGRDWEVDHKA